MGLLRSFLWLFAPRRQGDQGHETTDSYRPHPAPVRTTPQVPTKSFSHPQGVIGQQIIRGHCWVIDGDTIVINKIHIRLAGIDAPELDQPYGQNAKHALMKLCRGRIVTAVTDGSQSHERAVATCTLKDGRDLSAEMVRAGLALDWGKYSGGRYRHLEGEGLRKKLWRVDARHKGRMPPSGNQSHAHGVPTSGEPKA